jgi:hypothetical protein
MDIINDYKDVIQKYRDIALSDKEVLQLVQGRANIILYPDLYKYEMLDEILEPYGACFLLYEAKKNYGHWCCVFKTDHNSIEMFDPYGGYPDTQLNYIPANFRKVSHQDVPHLSYLMYNSPYELSYNEHDFQGHKSDIKTCGRWCATRLIFRDTPLKQFARIFKRPNGDNLVTLLTMWVNN